MQAWTFQSGILAVELMMERFKLSKFECLWEQSISSRTWAGSAMDLDLDYRRTNHRHIWNLADSLGTISGYLWLGAPAHCLVGNPWLSTKQRMTQRFNRTVQHLLVDRPISFNADVTEVNRGDFHVRDTSPKPRCAPGDEHIQLEEPSRKLFKIIIILQGVSRTTKCCCVQENPLKKGKLKQTSRMM